ncbi:protein-arginine deiminase [Purpureocillium lavendulum]|uniref:Protein-arginine deiminase n=1 Tax=Purpureocillium lavendulum TaxID=1247861 RepID=A0AB34FK83_9HYPO|nr:protein-arginine deiminase [Purpureocillium lavendulum]
MKATQTLVSLAALFEVAASLGQREAKEQGTSPPTIDLSTLSKGRYQPGSQTLDANMKAQDCWICNNMCCPYNWCCAAECCVPGANYCSADGRCWIVT